MQTRKHEPLGGSGKIVEADKTYWGHQEAAKLAKKRVTGGKLKMKIISLIERGGDARSFHVPAVNAKTLAPILRNQIAKKTPYDR